MIDFAAQFDPVLLRRLGARILSHVAPDVAERVEAEALRRQEARAYQGRALHLSPVGDGRVRLSGWLDVEDAAVVGAAIDPLCAPGRDREQGQARTPAQRRADALVDVCRLAMTTTELPANGGDRTQVVVTMSYDALRRRIGVATLDTGEHLTAAAARRLACDARILPAVLGSAGQILDVGEGRRLVTGSMRRALVLRDRTCAFPGCDRPARWCHAHHIHPWADGGRTELDNSVLLCGFHHRVIHEGQWTVRLGRDRRPDFIPPAWLDPQQAPRRNAYPRRL